MTPTSQKPLTNMVMPHDDTTFIGTTTTTTTTTTTPTPTPEAS